MFKHKTLLIFLILFIVFWTGFIFLMSSQTASDSDKISEKVTKVVITVGEKVGVIDYEASKSDALLLEYNLEVRKIAHVLMYFLLASVIFIALWWFKLNKGLSIFFSFCICIIIAFMDEINQMDFVGRNSGVISEGIKDIYKDTLGVVVALIILLIIRAIFEIQNKNVQ